MKRFICLIRGGDVLGLSEDSSVTRPIVLKGEKGTIEEGIRIEEVQRTADPVWNEGALLKTVPLEIKTSQRIQEDNNYER